MSRNVTAAVIMVGLVGWTLEGADKRASHKQQLAPLQSLIGSWKGVGQVRRGSTDGAWVENSDWIWKFSDDAASLEFSSEKAKYFASGSLRPDHRPDEFVLVAVPAKGDKPVEYRGTVGDDGQLVLTAGAPEPLPERISIRTVAHGDRLVILYERRPPMSDRYSRLAEVGYTRKGSGFGQGSNQPECVVTGGYGSIQVSHKGQSYYVCCTGCRDMFNDDPESVLAEYRDRKAAEREKRQKEAEESRKPGK